MTPRSFALLALLIAAAVVTWIAATSESERTASSGITTNVESGYYVLDAVIFGSNELGEPRYEIHAKEARQRDSAAPIEMLGIEVRYTAIQEPTWQITAARAELDPTSRDLAMSGDVVARRADDALAKTMDLRTDTLLFKPNIEQIETEATVSFRVGASTLTALGMRASLPKDTIRLNSNVRGQYVP
ncbi:MAG: LPS export ABC transporter periplasmic protein LptC [Pseudomonadota bacterium]